jgi:hypothetical protein
MRPLTTQFAAEVDSSVRRRGADYFRAGRVQVDSSSASQIVATVLGSSRYRVVLQHEGRKVHASCTCPYFDIDLCKHIWAVVLMVERENLLNGENLKLVPRDLEDVRAAYDFEEDDDGPGHDGEGEGAGDDEDTLWPSVPARAAHRVMPRALSQRSRHPVKTRTPIWREQIARLHAKPQAYTPKAEVWPPTRELLYVVDVSNAQVDGGVSLEILCRDLKSDGGWSKPKPRYLRREWQRQIPSAEDRHILAFLTGAVPEHSPGYISYSPALPHDGTLPYRYRLVDPQPRTILPLLCRTGRCHLRSSTHDDDEELSSPLQWQEREAWELRLALRRSQQDDHYELAGALARGEERMELTAPLVLYAAGMFFMPEYAAPFEHHGAFDWIALLRAHGPLKVPVAQGEDLLAELLRQPRLPPLDLPNELRYEESVVAPQPRLVVKTENNGQHREQLRGELSFDYNHHGLWSTGQGNDPAPRAPIHAA